MKRYIDKILIVLFMVGFMLSCGELDHKNTEFYKQEVYIISAESTSASEREIDNIVAHTFVDTMKIINDSYDVKLLEDNDDGETLVTFKVGIGGSLAAAKDIVVKVGFDEEGLNDYNMVKNTQYTIPSSDLYSSSVPFNETSETFDVTIPKGTSSLALTFKMPIKRDLKETYANYAFPLKLVEADGVLISRQYSKFLLANFIVNVDKKVNWSGFPIPKLPEGRYHSARLQGNAAENTTPDGYHRVYKWITRLGDTDELKDQYTIWGTGVWSFDMHGFNGAGWMYNKLSLNDEVFGTYTVEPILEGDTDFPFHTFKWSSTQNPSYDNRYDPKTKTLTIHYKNIIGQDYTDVLTYVDDDWTLKKGNKRESVENWHHIRSKGYNYWLPIDDPDIDAE
ncbi:DUF1735 domain-containing protein [Puteibacter caeruleilacunae]|nr:DUF1735 domain-containing protein [Puteibacter caeruleilacunae]